MIFFNFYLAFQVWFVLYTSVTCVAGTGERSDEPPASATESIPAVSLEYTCAGLYQTFSLVNNTTPFTDIMNKSASSWSLSASINTFHLHEVCGVTHPLNAQL